MLVNAALSALLNVVLLAAVPFAVYYSFQRWRRQREPAEIRRRVGLQLGELRYVGYCAAAAVVAVAALLVWSPPTEPFVREGGAQRNFAGLGWGGPAIPMALLYGLVKTGFAEEFLFRGMIAGSLSRRLSLWAANIVQSVIFLLPHLLLLFIMPEMWGIMPVIFAFSLFKGWARIRSGSIVGPWILHGAANVTMCLYVAVSTA